MSLRVINLGRMAYTPALAIQQKLFEKVKHESYSANNHQQGNCDNYLLLVEHDPVYTVGIRRERYAEDHEFRRTATRLGAQFIATNRGGLITFHGPGQLVAYPIVNLAQHSRATNRSVKKFVCLLEQVIIDICGTTLGIEGVDRLPKYPGVWVRSDRKIAALGIHASRHVTMHGVAINCDCDLDWFAHIVPCGIEGKSVTSISREIGKRVEVREIAPLFIENFCQRLCIEPDRVVIEK